MIPHNTLQDDPLLSYFHQYASGDESIPQLHRDTLAPAIGEGNITCIGIEEGFCAAHYDLRFNHDFTFRFPGNRNVVQLYRLVFPLSTTDPEEQFFAPHFLTNNKTSFNAINFERLAFVPKGKSYESIEMVFSKTWLQKNYADHAAKIFKLLQLLGAKKDPSYLSELLDKSTYDTASSIAADLRNRNTVFLHIKAQLFVLVDDFFQKSVTRSQRNLKKSQALHYGVIRDIERSLSKYYGDELPSICTLAKEFNIGSSTLKRQFKLVFNKSIYSYYLEQKMALGMAMLQEKNASVSEIAYRLGYHKINSFSKIFKKHYGVLPSQFATANP